MGARRDALFDWMAEVGVQLIFCGALAGVLTWLLLAAMQDRKRHDGPPWDKMPPWESADILVVSPRSKVVFFDAHGALCAALLDDAGNPVSVSCVPSRHRAETAPTGEAGPASP